MPVVNATNFGCGSFRRCLHHNVICRRCQLSRMMATYTQPNMCLSFERSVDVLLMAQSINGQASDCGISARQRRFGLAVPGRHVAAGAVAAGARSACRETSPDDCHARQRVCLKSTPSRTELLLLLDKVLALEFSVLAAGDVMTYRAWQVHTGRLRLHRMSMWSFSGFTGAELIVEGPTHVCMHLFATQKQKHMSGTAPCSSRTDESHLHALTRLCSKHVQRVPG